MSLRYNFVVIFLSVFFVLLFRILSQHIILLLPLSLWGISLLDATPGISTVVM